MAERMKLTILTVKEVQKVGEKQREKLTFLAKGEDSKECSYFTFRTSLFDAIRNNKEIEADVEVTETPHETGVYINRNVSEVYVDGKPVGAQKSSFTGAHQWRGKSPEEIASIEAQVAVKAAVELIIADKIPSNSPLALAVNDWLFLKLGVKPLSRGTATKQVGGKPLDTPRQIEIDGVEVASEGDVPTPLERFKYECLRYGWDVKTKKGAETVRAWLIQQFDCKWQDLTLEAQERAIEQMRQMADLKQDSLPNGDE